jgi:O-antigen ligase
LTLALAFSPSLTARLRALFAGAFFAAMASLFLSLSRAGLLATGLSSSLCFLVIWARNARLGVFRRETLAVVLGGCLMVLALSGKMIARFTEKDAGASENRLHQYRVAGEIIRHHPLVGVGLNSYRNVSYKFDHTAARISTTFKAPVHNVYLLTLAETGLVGLGALFILMGAMLNLAWFGRWPVGSAAFDLHLGLFFGLVGYFLHANLDINPIGSYAVVFFLMGVLTSAQRIERSA